MDINEVDYELPSEDAVEDMEELLFEGQETDSEEIDHLVRNFRDTVD